MKSKFKGKKWLLLTARDELTICPNILGFGKGGVLKYRVEADGRVKSFSKLPA